MLVGGSSCLVYASHGWKVAYHGKGAVEEAVDRPLQPSFVCLCAVCMACSLQVNHGQIDVDQSALTGESLPVTIFAGESAKMGSTVVRGEVRRGVGTASCAWSGWVSCCARMVCSLVLLHASLHEPARSYP